MDANRVKRAHELCDSGKFADALELFKGLAFQSAYPVEEAGFLMDAATCYGEIRDLDQARICATKAKQLVEGDAMASAQIDFVVATLLIDEGKREQALEELTRLSKNYRSVLETGEGRQLHEEIETQRAYTLMHLAKYEEARPILEAAGSYELGNESKSRVCCHRGRCYVELGLYDAAREQFPTGTDTRNH
jgi:tetratricopeptide (TPR) repeat protein